MFKIITNARCVGSQGGRLGHLVIAHGRIQRILPGDEGVSTAYRDLAEEVVDLRGKIVVPGLIDGHTHPLGAAGESGFGSRAPEIPMELFFKSGITTIVGMLGLDDRSRTVAQLIARTRALRAGGLEALCLSGSYRFPPANLGGSVPWDIYFIPEVIGAGEIALSDVRSSAPTTDELRRFVQESFTAAAGAGKKGVVHFHIGDEISGLDPVHNLLEGTGIDGSRIITTHLNRNERLMLGAPTLAKRGVWCDLTAIEFECFPTGFLPAEKALGVLVRDNPEMLSRVTVSSDCGTVVETGRATSPGSLMRAFQRSADPTALGLETAVRVFMENPAECYGLKSKGFINPGMDADLLVLNNHYGIEQVYAGGRRVVVDGGVIVGESISRAYPD